jgi:methionine-rich copper-binding protein CopC
VSSKSRRIDRANVWKYVAGSLLIVATFGLVVPAAIGATTLVSSDPKDKSTATTAPQQILLTFSQAPLTVGDAVSVINPKGASIAQDSPTIAGTQLTERLPELTVNGLYTVVWRILNSDRQTVTGQFTFTLNVAGLPTVTPPPTASSNTTWKRLAWILAGSAIVIVLVVVVTAFVGRKGKDAELTDEPPAEH